MGRARLLRAARAPGVVHAARHAGSDQRLRFRSAQRDAATNWSISTCSTSGAVRLSVGAVQVLHRQHEYFDTAAQRVGPEHIMASGALPPGFPPIDDRRRALLGRRPRLQHAAAIRARRSGPREDMLRLSGRSVQRHAATCRRPCSMSASARRRSAIRAAPGSTPTSSASCRPCAGPSASLRPNVPRRARRQPALAAARQPGCDAAVTIVQLIHRRAAYWTPSNDYEFSRYTMEEHWAAGRDDVEHTLSHPAWKNRSRPRKA